MTVHRSKFDAKNWLFLLKGNVLKELVSPAGADIFVSEFQLGDPTLSVLEIWGAEYQESNAMLVNAEHKALLQSISAREKCPVSFVGRVTGNGKVFETRSSSFK